MKPCSSAKALPTVITRVLSVLGVGTRQHAARQFAVSRLVLLVALACANVAFGGEIHNAAMNGDVAKVKALLKADPSLVFSKDEYGWTPLETLAATVKTSSDMVLDFGSSYGTTANATETKKVMKPFDSPEALEIAELLITNGAEIDGGAGRASSLLQAVKNKNWRLADLLIKKGARVDVTMPAGPNDPGMTPLHYAAGYGGVEIAKLLIANKAKVDAKDKNNRTPLHFAAMLGQKDVMELLIANKADINAKDVKGWTPLQWAEDYDQGVVAALLRQHGGHK
jgi:ankyrin repeat protein